MPKALIHARLYDYDTYVEDGYIIFDKTIQTIGKMKDFEDKDYMIIDVEGALVIPSFVIGHTHIYSTFARGLALPFNPSDFQEILNQMWWRLDHYLDNKTTYYSGIVNAVDMVKNGVTTVIDHHASGQDIIGALDALKRSVCDTVGMRGMFSFETSDRFDIDQCIKENSQFINTHKTHDVSGHFGLHASMSLSEDTLKKVSKALHKAPIHIHVAESEMDEDDAIKHYGERVVERLARHNLLTKDSIITHGLFLNNDELALLKKHECVVALNVSSNMNNGVGLPQYKQLKAHNIPVIIGNDGLSTGITNEYLNVLYSTHLREENPNAFTLDDLKRIIQDTYLYVGRQLSIPIGQLKKDYVADFQVIPYNPPTPLDKDNVLGHMFYGLFHSFKPKHVFKDGTYLVKDYAVSDHLESLYKEAVQVAQALWDRIKKEGNPYES